MDQEKPISVGENDQWTLEFPKIRKRNNPKIIESKFGMLEIYETDF